MATDDGRADHRHVQVLAEPGNLHVEIVDHFHVLGEESDRRHDDVAAAGIAAKGGQAVTDVGFQPGLFGGTAAALVDQVPRARPASLRHKPTGLGLVPRIRSGRQSPGGGYGP